MVEEQEAKRKRKLAKESDWFYHPFFKYASAILLVLTILLVFSYVASFLTPVADFISILFIPIVLSLMLYYLLRPLVRLLEERIKLPRWVGILCIYLVVALLLVFFVAYVGPLLVRQMTELANSSVEMIEKMKKSAQSISTELLNINLDREIEQRIFDFIQQISTVLSKNAVDILGFLTRFAVILIVIPFILFYLLKDDRRFMQDFMNMVPENFGREAEKILKNMDRTLSDYFQGVITVSLVMGGLLLIGYLLIGLNYAFLLSVLAVVFMTIPFLGPFLAICPALFVGLSHSPYMALKVLIVFIIIQQFEANVISPHVIGQKLNIHPLTIILLLLAAGSLYGFIGLILATPLYAITKILIANLYKIYRLRYSIKS